PRGNSVDIVTKGETIESFQPVRDDLDRLSRALYAAELIDRFTEPHEEQFVLYRLLLDTLRRVGARPDIDTPVRFFEMALLNLLGYRPELEECVACGGKLAPVTNYWAGAAGGIVSQASRREASGERPSL